MMEAYIDNILAILFCVIWIMTFIWYHYKNRSYDAGSFIITMYIIYAIFSIVSLNDDLLSDQYNSLSLFPYIYLYLMLLIAMSPSIWYHFSPSDSIKDPQSRSIFLLSSVIVLCSLLNIPQLFSSAESGNVFSVATDIELAKDAYEDQSASVSESGSAIRNIPAIIYNALSDFIPFFAFYFMTKKKRNYFIIAGLFLALCIGLLVDVMNGQRGGLIMTSLTTIGCFLLFKRYLASRIINLIKYIGLCVISLLLIPLVTLTIGRFGEDQSIVWSFVSWYIGQGSLYFNNYALDDGGIRYGDRTINLIKRLINPDTPRNYEERRDLYSHLSIDDDRFTTFVGDFTIDFGPVIPVFIFIIFSYFVIKKINKDNNQHSLQQLLLLYFTICISLQGGMTLFSYSDTGNLRIFMFILLYTYLCCHDILLEKYPLINRKNETADNTDN